jgi:hypothetical protein
MDGIDRFASNLGLNIFIFALVLNVYRSKLWSY